MRRRRKLRIVAAGGDGTVAWLLSTIKKLDVSPPPAVGVLPLGTGNGISVNLGWGKKTQPRSLKARHARCRAPAHAPARRISRLIASSAPFAARDPERGGGRT